MKTVAKELSYVLSLTIISFVISKFIWLLPIILFLPIILTYTIDGPLIHLFVLGIIAELFTFSPPGLMLAVVLLPWIIFRVFGKLQVDVSFLFGLVIILTVLLQLSLIYLPDIYIAKNIMVVPWLKVIPILLFTSAIALLTSIAIYFNRSI